MIGSVWLWIVAQPTLHLCFNDVKNEGQSCGFSDMFKTQIIIADTFYGPYDSAGFHEKAHCFMCVCVCVIVLLVICACMGVSG